MNILLLTNKLDYTDGVTTHLYYLVKNLKNKGISFFIICSGGDAIDKFTSLDVNIKVYEKLNFYNRSVSNFINTSRYIYQFSRSRKIQIIHSHNHYIANAAALTSKLSGIKTVQTIHGLIQRKGLFKLYVSDYYIGVNNHITDFLKDNKIESAENIALIYNGIDIESNGNKIEKNFNKVICASRLVKEKGVDLLIKAAADLNDTIKSGKEFVISGEGDFENELKNLNAKLGNPVYFTGIKKSMESEFDSAGIFVMPTVSVSEGFPMTMLEAGKSGCLVISSDFIGSESIIKNNHDALIFKLNDPDDLKSKLEFAFLNNDICRKLSEEFQKKVRNNFSSDVMAQRHFEFYNKVLFR